MRKPHRHGPSRTENHTKKKSKKKSARRPYRSRGPTKRGYRRTAVRRTALPSTDFFRGFFFGVVGSCSTWGCPGPIFFRKKKFLKLHRSFLKIPEASRSFLKLRRRFLMLHRSTCLPLLDPAVTSSKQASKPCFCPRTRARTHTYTTSA